MTKLSIAPRQGLVGCRFGMSPAEVGAILGEGERERPSDGRFMVYYPNWMNVGYQNDVALMIGATKRTKGLFYEELDIFAADPFAVLRRMESDAGQAFETMGFIVFPSLGISLTGFHAGDRDEKAFTISRDGEWDGIEKDGAAISFLR